MKRKNHQIHGRSAHLGDRRSNKARFSCLLNASSAAIANQIISKVLASSLLGRRNERGAVNRLMQFDDSRCGPAHLSPLRSDHLSCLFPDGSCLFAVFGVRLRSSRRQRGCQMMRLFLRNGVGKQEHNNGSKLPAQQKLTSSLLQPNECALSSSASSPMILKLTSTRVS